MRAFDQLAFAAANLVALRVRTALILLAMATGTAGVVLLSWLGDSARGFVAAEFAALGTNLVIVLPGRAETTGGAPPLLGETSRDLTLDDALALERSPYIARQAPLVAGTASVRAGGRERETMILGSTAELLPIRRLALEAGANLPAGDPRRGDAVCLLGSKLREELFGSAPALGELVRIGDRRCRVVGVLAAVGQSLGNDLDEMAIVPVAFAQALFDTAGLFRVLAEARSREALPQAVASCERILAERHEGERDVTVITQEAVLSTFDAVLRSLTFAVAGIAAVSLVVAGILIMNVMVVAVTQRRAEVGLLKALGAPAPRIRTLFLVEATLLSVAGSLLGIAAGEAGSRIVPVFVPMLAPGAPAWASAGALTVACVTGIVFGVMPARRAARLDPVLALARR